MGIGWEQKNNWHIHGKECVFWLQTRPHYCDRGNYLVLIHYWGSLSRAGEIDDSDLWPRYYFDFEAAQNEVIAWLKTRELYIEGFSVWKNEIGSIDGMCCNESE